MATDQAPLTVLVPVLPGKVEELRHLLDEIGADPRENRWVPFDRLETVHFIRWVLLDEARDAEGGPIRPTLVFSTVYDRPLERHLDELVRVAGTGLDRIYRLCEGYPEAGSARPQGVVRYLRRAAVPANALYNGTRFRSQAQIRDEAALHRRLQDFLAERATDPSWPPGDPSQVHAALERAARKDASLLPVLDSTGRPTLGQRLARAAAAVGRALRKVPLLVATLPRWRALRELERSDAKAYAHARAAKAKRDPRARQRLADNRLLEDRIVQNQMTHVVNVKPGRLRRAVLELILAFMDLRAHVYDTKGDLGGVTSIHFCHWTIIDQGRRLLFLSNYDGSWENYLDAFINENSEGVTGIWSNTEGYPPTEKVAHLIDPDVADLKAWVRAHQVPTQVWYSAYPKLTVENVNNSTAVRVGMARPGDAAAMTKWLGLI